LLFSVLSTHSRSDDQVLTPRSHRRFAQPAAGAVPADIPVRQNLLATHLWIVGSALTPLSNGTARSQPDGPDRALGNEQDVIREHV
jgi:hypothetical protein